jgi:hypothetical protein
VPVNCIFLMSYTIFPGFSSSEFLYLSSLLPSYLYMLTRLSTPRLQTTLIFPGVLCSAHLLYLIIVLVPHFFLVLQCYSTQPPHHHRLYPLQKLHIFHLHSLPFTFKKHHMVSELEIILDICSTHTYHVS